jgi:putative mRNA 3-end processing factor
MMQLLSRLPSGEVVATPVTIAVAELLTRDALKVARMEGYLPPYDPGDIRGLLGRFTAVERKGTWRRRGIEVELVPAGHIPGATMFLYRGERDVLVTGDVQTVSTNLVAGAAGVGCDVLVMESTYAGREHPDRRETERTFRAKIEATLDRGGKVIVPAFAVGRAQEVLLTLSHHGYEIWLDGMARSVNDIYQAAPEYLADSRKFRRALEEVNIVEHSGQRRHALREADVIVTTGGMLDGGPVLFYIGELYRDHRNSIYLTGFQVEGSNGRQLLDRGTLTIDDVTIQPACEVQKFDFSAHAGHSELVNLVRTARPKKVVLMHGDRRELLADALTPEGVEVLLPENGAKFAV